MMYLGLEGRRTGYSVEQCGGTMTVGELREFLREFDEDMPIYLVNDNGYTYGEISYSSFEEREEEDE